jgi:hypothetical protein
MLNGYENPDPTPIVPIVRAPDNWNRTFPRAPLDKARPEKPISERVYDCIVKEEALDRKPRDTSSIVIGETGIWRKIGNRTFYRLFGLHYRQHTADNNAIQEAIDKAQSRVFIKDNVSPGYIINGNIAPKTGIWIDGETSYGTRLKAGANNVKIFSVAGQPMYQMRFSHLGLDGNGKTGLTGIDINGLAVDEVVSYTQIYDIQVFNSPTGSFTTLIDASGNEGCGIDLVYWPPVGGAAGSGGGVTGDGFGDIYVGGLKYAGWVEATRITNNPAAGTSAALHIFGGQVMVKDCVLNTILVDNQTPGGYNTHGTIYLEGDYMANSQPPSVPGKIQQGNLYTFTVGNTVLSMELVGNYIGLANSKSLFYNASPYQITINRLGMHGNTFINLDASAVTWVGGTASLSTWGSLLDWSANNYISGTIGSGVAMGGGFGNYLFYAPPAGWGWPSGGGWGTGTTTPSVPAGTGSANAVRNRSNRPILIYQPGAVGTHIIDSEGNNLGSAIDAALGVDPPVVQLNPFERIYYATTVPATWKFYGL